MKTKIFLLFLLLIFSPTYAEENSLLNKVSDNFQNECYKYSGKINVLDLKDNLLGGKNQTYKISLNTVKDLKIIQNEYISPFKIMHSESKYIDYTNIYGISEKDANDNNRNTSIIIDTLDQKEIIYELNKTIFANTFDFNINYESKQNYFDLYISTDGENYSKVDKSNITDFDIKYIKLKIECYKDMCIREKIKIYELNFIEDRKIIVLNSFFDNDIELYSNYNCKDNKYTQEAKYFDKYSVDSQTQIIDLDLENNPKYNLYTKKDFDKDGIDDEFDNCPLIGNTDQKDSDASGKGDACSDKDSDGIIGEKDNCPTIYNPKQEDGDKNGIGDLCESDEDKDGVYDSIDNCLSIANPNQEDDDGDRIGNVCDNCSLKYNVDQSDVDKDSIGDICDLKDDRYIESNKGFFIGLLIFITIIFGAGIFFIIKKLK